MEEEECLKVKDVFGPNGWDWSKLSIQIPNAVLMEIKAMPYSFRSSNEEDRMIWNGANRGDFELKSAYNLATKCSKEEEEFKGSWVWKVDTLPRIKTLEWGNVLLKDALVKLTLALSAKGKSRQSFIDLGIVSRPKSPGADLEFCQSAVRVIYIIGSKRIAKTMFQECKTSPRGELSFLLLFGICGNKEIILCSRIGPSRTTCTVKP